MNIYTQAVPDQKRAANSKVVEMVLPRPVKAEEPARKPAAPNAHNAFIHLRIPFPAQHARTH